LCDNVVLDDIEIVLLLLDMFEHAYKYLDLCKLFNVDCVIRDIS